MATLAKRKPDPINVELDGDLKGSSILVDPSALTMGLLEDIQASAATVMLDAVAATLVGGNLEHGVDRAGLRRLTPAEFAEVCSGVASCIRIRKS